MLRTIYGFLTSDVGRNLLASIAALITISTFLYRLYKRASRNYPRKTGAGNPLPPELPAPEETWLSHLFLIFLCGFLLGFIGMMATPPSSWLNVLATLVSAICLLAWMVVGYVISSRA